MKRLILTLTIFSTLFITGCWDMVEIEDRLYPYSVGVEINTDESKEGKYLFTISYPNISAIGKNATSEDLVYLIDETGNTIFEVLHKLSTRLQRPMHLKLLKVIVLTEGVAKDEKSVQQIIDGLNRDFIINKALSMLVAKGSAKDLITAGLKSKRQAAIEGTLNSMLINKQQATMFTPISISDFIEDIDTTNAAIVPLVISGEEDIIISGSALFKNYKLIGYIKPMENRAIALVNNRVNEDSVEVEYKGNSLALMITGSKTKKTLVSKEDNLKMKFDIELEGHIQSFSLDQDMSIETEEMLEALQDAAAQSVKKDVEDVIEKLQKEFNADAIQIAEYLRRFHPKLWKEIEKDWDKIFPDIDIEVNVKVDIRRRGLTT